MEKILVTGANGLLGQKLIRMAPGFGIKEVVATARGPARIKPAAGVTYKELDITNRESVNKLIAQESPDSVIHAAAMTNVDACEKDREEAWKVNTLATRYIAETCDAHGIHLVHVSTDFIFDGKNGPYSEDAVPSPLSYYGETKLEAEQQVMKMKSGWAILRTVLVYGVTEGMSRSNIVLWARQALREGKEITVVTDQFRTPTLAEDLAQGCLIAATKKARGIFHISGGDQMSIYELVTRVADHFGLDKTLIKAGTSAGINQPAKRPPVTGFIIEKAKRELGYKPHTFEEGLKIVEDQLRLEGFS